MPNVTRSYHTTEKPNRFCVYSTHVFGNFRFILSFAKILSVFGFNGVQCCHSEVGRWKNHSNKCCGKQRSVVLIELRHFMEG